MNGLARELELLRDEVEFPATPDIAAAVRDRVAREPAPQPSRRRRRPATRRVPPRLVLALVAALVLFAALMAAVPSARDSVLDLFGLDGATVEVRPELPQRDVAPGLELGKRVTLDEAEEEAGFDVLVPEELGPPRATYLSPEAPGGEVTLLYGRDPLLLVTQFRGDLAEEYVGKIAGQASRVERFPGGVYISGVPHFFFYRTPDGAIREGSLRLAKDVLLLERNRLLIRIEGAGSFERARAIADSLR